MPIIIAKECFNIQNEVQSRAEETNNATWRTLSIPFPVRSCGEHRVDRTLPGSHDRDRHCRLSSGRISLVEAWLQEI